MHTSIDFKDVITTEVKNLNEAKSQTQYKIKYVTEYIRLWLCLTVKRTDVLNINFIDCMCNAGIYINNILGTPMEVLKLFIEFARLNPEKEFNLYLNDYDKEKIRIISYISSEINNDKSIKNIHVHISRMDVDDYLNNLFASGFDYYKSSTVLFVDPFKFGQPKLINIKRFIEKSYCELLYNFFNSDVRRNKNNLSAPKKIDEIKDCMEGFPGYNTSMTDEELLFFIKENLKSRPNDITFAYPFKIATNVVLYNIVYLTHHIRGLIFLKDVLWDVFDGIEFFKSSNYCDDGQGRLFSDEVDIAIKIEYYSNQSIDMLRKLYLGKTVSYKEIEIVVLERTMIKKNQIIDHIIKKLINNGSVVKLNKVRKNNYTEDDYYWKR